MGLKACHYADLLDALERRRAPAWVEIHPQNYFGSGGPPHRWLKAIADHLPISFHSVGLSLGSASGVDETELSALAALCERYEAAAVSDHLSWSNSGQEHFPDLLPVPYTFAALEHFTLQIDKVQERLGQAMLIENPSRYLAYRDADMSENEFLTALCRRTGCSLLLDINNIEVSAFNLGFDAADWLGEINPECVQEVHLAGHARKAGDDGHVMAIDDHGSKVRTSCFELAQRFFERAGPKPVLIEWDTNVPPYAILAEEVRKADALVVQEGVHA